MMPYGRHFVDEEDINEVVKVLKTDWLTTGPKIEEFEKRFAEYVGAKYAVAVANGTAALHLACLAAGLKQGDELITSPITFAASANCALYCNAKPVFADIKADNSGLIDPEEIRKKVNPNTKVIVPIHYSGLPSDLEEIRNIANAHNLIVIEDACHALGASYKGSRIGDCKYSDMAVFSFHPIKQITTGEGGMITTNSKELYERLVDFRTHGITKDKSRFDNQNEGDWYYEMHDLGFNYRITDFQCALGLSQLGKIDKFVQRRREIARKYDEAFRNNANFEVFSEPEDRKGSYHLYVLKLKDGSRRKELFAKLKNNNIGVQVHYIPVHIQPYYKKKFGYYKGNFPISEGFYEKVISLPVYYGLKDEEIEKVINIVKGDLE